MGERMSDDGAIWCDSCSLPDGCTWDHWCMRRFMQNRPPAPAVQPEPADEGCLECGHASGFHERLGCTHQHDYEGNTFMCPCRLPAVPAVHPEPGYRAAMWREVSLAPTLAMRLADAEVAAARGLALHDAMNAAFLADPYGEGWRAVQALMHK